MTIDLAIINGYRELPASTIYEANGKLGDLCPDIRPLSDDARLVGPAFTVKCWPGDLSAMRRAVDEAPPGFVLVIDGGERNRSTTWGGGATIVAKRRGLEGVVTNGLTRDVQQIKGLNFPVYCIGATVRGGVRNIAGWIGIPIAIGGAVVNEGDLVVGDADGVVVVARERAVAVLEAAREYERKTQARERDWQNGGSYNV